jgi:hypothetical protein
MNLRECAAFAEALYGEGRRMALIVTFGTGDLVNVSVVQDTGLPQPLMRVTAESVLGCAERLGELLRAHVSEKRQRAACERTV